MIPKPEHDVSLWNTLIIIVSELTSTFSSENPILQVDDVMEDVIFKENLEDKNTEITNDLEDIAKNKNES